MRRALTALVAAVGLCVGSAGAASADTPTVTPTASLPACAAGVAVAVDAALGVPYLLAHPGQAVLYLEVLVSNGFATSISCVVTLPGIATAPAATHLMAADPATPVTCWPLLSSLVCQIPVTVGPNSFGPFNFTVNFPAPAAPTP